MTAAIQAIHKLSSGKKWINIPAGDGQGTFLFFAGLCRQKYHSVERRQNHAREVCGRCWWGALLGSVAGREKREEISIFEIVGIDVQDLVTAKAIIIKLSKRK